MPSTTRIVALMSLAAALGRAQDGPSVPIAFCASVNTASMAGNTSIYQSDGLCFNFCSASYALAVIKDTECWCSDFEPDESVQVDVSKCNKGCPGFPSDLCGGDGLWGYMALNKEPSGTKSTGSSATKTSSPGTSSQPTGDSTTTPSVSTVTVGGTVMTVTAVPTDTTGADTGPPDTDPNGSTTQRGLSTGAAVGVAIGVVAAVALAIGAGFFFWLRRRRQQTQGDDLADSPGSHRGSSAGMMSTPTTAMASVWDGDNVAGARRNSRYMPHDPRMDPFATGIYSRENKSHESINTLQDNHDYSRKVLRTTNPDPPDAD